MEIDEVLETAQEPDSWMTPIKNFLLSGDLPAGRNDRKKLLRKAARFIIQDGVLYRRGFTAPMLRCVTEGEAKRILREIHEGACGGHSGGQTLAKQILRYGYFWPTVNRDALDFVKRCDQCQRFSEIKRTPSA